MLEDNGQVVGHFDGISFGVQGRLPVRHRKDNPFRNPVQLGRGFLQDLDIACAAVFVDGELDDDAALNAVLPALCRMNRKCPENNTIPDLRELLYIRMNSPRVSYKRYLP